MFGLKKWWQKKFGDRTFGSTRSPKWNKLRKEYLNKQTDCELCKKKAEALHHILPFHLFPEKELDQNNLMALCNDCHFSFGHFFNYRSYNAELRKDKERILNKP